MARGTKKPRHVKLEGVASNFRRDWQYLIAASRVNSALSLVTFFSALAVVTKFTDLTNLGKPALYSFVAASIIYALAIALIKLKAPAFIQDFPDYKSYDDKKNSPRWILWQFYHNIFRLKEGFKLLHESIEKRLSLEVAKWQMKVLPFVPKFDVSAEERTMTITLPDGQSSTYVIRAFKPVNFDRDLVMWFSMTSKIDQVEKRYILPIREDDPKCDLKCKELFWMVFTEAAKENRLSRLVAWLLIQVSAVLLIVAFVLAVFHSLLTPGLPAEIPTYFQYI